MSNITESPPEEAEERWLLPVYSLIPAIICIGGMIILAVGGNVLIIISYFRDKKLQNVHNLYILNLAFTDLFLGCISMPFYAVYTITVWHWPFGTVVCKFFLVVDFTLCLESVLLIIIISLDRLILVTKGAFYMSQETFKVGKIKVAVSWMFAFVLYSPAIIGWDYWSGESTVKPGDCDVEFAYNFHYTLVTSLIEFGVPFISISVLNTLLYRKINKRKKIYTTALNTVSHIQQNNEVSQGTGNTDSNEIAEVGPRDANTVNVNGNKAKDHTQPRNQVMSHRHFKAARALGVLILALVVCWAPYTIATIIVAVCDDCVSTDLYEVLNWLLWFKSCINPFLYALNSVRFRNNIKKLLFFWRKNG